MISEGDFTTALSGRLGLERSKVGSRVDPGVRPALLAFRDVSCSYTRRRAGQIHRVTVLSKVRWAGHGHKEPRGRQVDCVFK
jgi:hypothetical protein